MRALGNVFLVVAAVGFAAFPLVYQYRSRGAWRDHPMGVHLMAFMAGLAVVMTIAVVRRFVIELPEWVFTCMWLLVSGLVWWRVALLMVTPTEDLDSPRRRDDAPKHVGRSPDVPGRR